MKMEADRVKRYLYHNFRRSVFALGAARGSYKDVIWVVGDARSGTTWVSDLINFDGKRRELFEPFHPHFVSKMQRFTPHQYLRSNSRLPWLEALSDAVFTGRFTNSRTDDGQRARFYDGLLIKDIFANLMIKWVRSRFPELKIVLLIRNPFAVALSKSRKTNWYWGNDPGLLLQQAQLVEDYLGPHVDSIARVSAEGCFIERQLATWSVINKIPLLEAEASNTRVLFYEDVYRDPQGRITQLYTAFGMNADGVLLDQRQVSTPSRYSSSGSNIQSGTSPVSSWQNKLSSAQIDAGYRVLEEFGMDKLYDEQGMPSAANLMTLTGSGAQQRV